MQLFGQNYSHEQASLIQANAGKICAYLWAIANVTGGNESFFEKLIQFGFENQQLPEVQELLPEIWNVRWRGSEDDRCYEVLFSSPWASHSDIEEEHSEITRSITKWFKTSNESVADPLQMILINMLMYLSPDETDLSERQGPVQFKLFLP